MKIKLSITLNNICIAIPFNSPRKKLCGSIWLNATPSEKLGTIHDVNCPDCLKIYEWIKAGGLDA